MVLQKNLECQLRSTKKYHFSPHISLLYSNTTIKMKKEIIDQLRLKSTFKMDRICAVETNLNVANWENIIETKIHA